MSQKLPDIWLNHLAPSFISRERQTYSFRNISGMAVKCFNRVLAYFTFSSMVVRENPSFTFGALLGEILLFMALIIARGHFACFTGMATSAANRSIGSTTGCTITEKAPTRAFSWLKAPTSAFKFKTLLRHYAKRALTPRSLNV